MKNNDLYANNEIAQAYAHMLSSYQFEMPQKEKENIMRSCVSFLRSSPKDAKIKLLNNYGGHTVPSEEIEAIEIHCKNHKIDLNK